MRSGWAPILALALASCGASAEERRCAAFAASVDISDYVDPATGRLFRDEHGAVLEPRTGRVMLTRAQVDCITREAQKPIDRYEKGG